MIASVNICKDLQGTICNRIMYVSIDAIKIIPKTGENNFMITQIVTLHFDGAIYHLCFFI